LNKFCLLHPKSYIEFTSDFLVSVPLGSCSECAVKMSFSGFEFSKFVIDKINTKDDKIT
jgi:hypothetical protein